MQEQKKPIRFGNPTVRDIEWMYKDTLADALHIRVTVYLQRLPPHIYRDAETLKKPKLKINFL